MSENTPSFLTRSQLRERGISWSNYYLLRLEKCGRFPSRVRLGQRTPVWPRAEIDAWLRDRAAERNTSSVAA